MYNETPASQTFPDTSVILRGGRSYDPLTQEWDFTECLFYVSYAFEDNSISLFIYDNATRTYPLDPEYVKSLDRAKEILEMVDMEYPEVIDVDNFLKTFELFYQVAPQTVHVRTPISDINDSCDQCGDSNVDTLEFLYIPAVEGTDFPEGSIDLHWEYGCYGGKQIAGSYTDCHEKAMETLIRAKDAATSKKYRREVQKAIAGLKA